MTSVMNMRDLEFMLFDWLDLETLLANSRFADHEPAAIRAMIDAVEEFSRERIAPHLRRSDTHEPELDAEGNVHVLPEVAEAVRDLAAMGIFASVFDKEHDGLQLPHLVYMAMMGVLMSGGIATASYMMLAVANARLLASFGSRRQFETFAAPQLTGRALGTMCLSEPQAGSSLADIVTRADHEGEDELGPRYRIRGKKMWISAGDHDITGEIYHLVLAKIARPDGGLDAGTRAISLFAVPKILPDGTRNDISVVGLNHKMGYRGIPNCELAFGANSDGAVGWLIGEPGNGLPQMFQMMNEARISVGMGGAMLAYRGWLIALDYARTRLQGRLQGNPDGPVPIIRHPDVKRMLLTQKCYAEGAMALVLYSARLYDIASHGDDEAERQSAADLLALLTPITKTWPSEWAQTSLHNSIQIFGGAGYTRDWEVELLYRDNRLNPIHEGTTGIQGMDLVLRKIIRDRGKVFSTLVSRVSQTISRGRAGGLGEVADRLEAAWQQLTRAVGQLIEQGHGDAAVTHATPVLEALGHGVMGWLWLDQALAAASAALNRDGMDDFALGKQHAAEFFAAYELPRVEAMLAPLFLDAGAVTAMEDGHFLG